MRSLVVGASAGLGRALATQLAEAGHSLFLVASDDRDLDPLVRDLRTRFGTVVASHAVDLAVADAVHFRPGAIAALGGIDNVFIVAGFSTPRQDRGPIAPGDLERLMRVNLTACIQIVNAFLPDLAQAPNGNLVGVGSVAAGRGRRNNMVYGTAKRGLDFYFEACRHWLAGENGARVQFYTLGYLRTSMTFGQKMPFPAMEPETAARRILANLGRDRGSRYLPGWWALIMLIIRLLPWRIFRRLDI